MKFEGRFRRVEYKPRSPVYLIILLLLIVVLMMFIRIRKGG
jgi:hypothetical protein